ncbi:MAG: FtsQ-type POTRA domain-containing protein [Methyloprofundus sp.]|nr:FtsQ-type POTRA domain-containing protein [Methyloprofundus sp.]
MTEEIRQQFVVVIFVLIVVTLSWLPISQFIKDLQPIRFVRVGGEFQFIKKEEIKEKISPLLNTGYFSVDLLAIQQVVMSLPWIDKVLVQRVWPNRVELKVYEQKPLVRWREKELLNVRSEVFKPISIEGFKSLPILNTPDGLQKEFLLTMQKMNQVLSEHDLELTEFRVNERLAWSVLLKNGIKIQLGRVEPLQKFMQLMRTLTVLGKKVNQIAYIDMRYSNGYAVRWRENTKINW